MGYLSQPADDAFEVLEEVSQETDKWSRIRDADGIRALETLIEGDIAYARALAEMAGPDERPGVLACSAAREGLIHDAIASICVELQNPEAEHSHRLAQVGCFETAANLDPDCEYDLLLGLALIEIGRIEEARSALVSASSGDDVEIVKAARTALNRIGKSVAEPANSTGANTTVTATPDDGLSVHGKTVCSLVEDGYEAAKRAKRIGYVLDSIDAMRGCLRGDLALARVQADAAPEEERAFLIALCCDRQAMVHGFIAERCEEYDDTLKRRKHLESAHSLFDEEVRYSPSPEAHLNLGLVLKKLGKRDLAVSALTIAANGDDTDIAVKARKYLTRLEAETKDLEERRKLEAEEKVQREKREALEADLRRVAEERAREAERREYLKREAEDAERQRRVRARLCIVCAKPLGLIDRLTGSVQHGECEK
jgi:tetratricopeptide (TPR) repeat protein